MKFKKANGYAAIIVIVIIAMMFISYWAIMPAFAKIFNYFNDDTEFNARHTTEESCENIGYIEID